MIAHTERTDASTVPSLIRVMTDVAEWVGSSAGVFLGHVKMAVLTAKNTVTLNLTDLETGTERHGSLPDGLPAEIRFMAAVVDVDPDKLSERMRKALASEGFTIKERKRIVDLR
jgi:hypothetical protein